MTPGERVEQICEDDVRAALGDRPRDVALLLSGGVDSTLVGLAAHALGHRVHAYTFQLGTKPTFDSKWAERTAGLMEWDWHRVDLPTDPDALVADWPRMWDLDCRKKREWECCWPFLYVYPAVKQRHVLSGLNADAFFALGRKSAKMGAGGRQSVREKFDEWRRAYCARLAREGRECVTAEFNPSCLHQHFSLQRESRLVDVNPFLSRDMYKFLMRFSWQELNLPKQKRFLREAYPELVAQIGARNHQNYQHAGRISDHFESLLPTRVNYRKRGRVIDMMGDFWRPSAQAAAGALVDGLRDKERRR